MNVEIEFDAMRNRRRVRLTLAGPEVDALTEGRVLSEIVLERPGEGPRSLEVLVIPVDRQEP